MQTQSLQQSREPRVTNLLETLATLPLDMENSLEKMCSCCEFCSLPTNSQIQVAAQLSVIRFLVPIPCNFSHKKDTLGFGILENFRGRGRYFRSPVEKFWGLDCVLRIAEGTRCLPACFRISVLPFGRTMKPSFRMSNPSPVSRRSPPSSPFLPLHRSRDLPLDPPPSRTGYLSIANLSAWCILTSSLWLLFGLSVCRTDDRCSSHTQALLVFFLADTHASSRKAYEEGEERVQCSIVVYVSSREECQEETHGREDSR